MMMMMMKSSPYPTRGKACTRFWQTATVLQKKKKKKTRVAYIYALYSQWIIIIIFQHSFIHSFDRVSYKYSITITMSKVVYYCCLPVLKLFLYQKKNYRFVLCVIFKYLYCIVFIVLPLLQLK